MTDTEDQAPFVISRVFDAPRERVWDAWTKPEQLARWFGPKGVTTTVLAFDLRPGGMLHARMDTPGGGAMWSKFVYRDVNPPTRLVWMHSFSDETAAIARAPFFDGVWPLVLLSTVVFEDEGARTRVTLTWQPFEATEDERATFEGNKQSMTGGWTGSFDQLDAMLGDGAR